MLHHYLNHGYFPGMIAGGRIVCKRGVGSGLNLLNLDTYLTSDFCLWGGEGLVIMTNNRSHLLHLWQLL
jgi:hypothetical protein